MRRLRKSTANKITATISPEVIIVEDSVPEHFVGPMNFVCKHCKSKNFEFEQNSLGHYTKCCQNGKVKIDIPTVPSMLKELFLMDNQFINSIRYFKSCESILYPI